MSGPKSLDEVDPELPKAYEKLGIPAEEQAILAVCNSSRKRERTALDEDGNPARRAKIAVDAVFD